nr:polycystic kidney disease 1-related protein [Parasteatoda tepidariorum]
MEVMVEQHSNPYRSKIPNSEEFFLYEWHFNDTIKSTDLYTTFPFAESHILLKPGFLSITVSVQSNGMKKSSTLTIQISEIPTYPCLHHKTVAEAGKPLDFYVFGHPFSNNSANASLKLIISRNERSYILSPSRFRNLRNFPLSSTYGWRYIFYTSAGFSHIIGQVFLMNSDFTSNVTFTLGIQTQKAPQIVYIRGPKIIPVSRIPLRQQWEADLKPSSPGIVFIWSFQNVRRISKFSKLTIHEEIPPGTHELKLTVSNSFGHAKTSMLVKAAVTLIALNYTFSNLLVDRESWLSVFLNQPDPPDVVFVDFGDSKYDSRYNESAFSYETLQHNESVFTVHHVFSSPGLHNVYFNVSNSVSSVELWTVASVEEPIFDISLELLSPSVVALLEDVIVVCTVESGTNLDFMWDFGDGTDGLYTAVNSTKNTSVAIHSYGVADTYDILVQVFNTYESITTYLNVSIQAVEPIEELHIRSRLNQYAAPLYALKTESLNSNQTYATDPVVFEAGVWRGSDIQFHFDFGDGQSKLVDSELNFRSLPYANVKHSYTAEGIYDVKVTATNPLDSMNQSLPHPFYVQFPPEGLKLDRQYYIIQYLDNLTVQASITSGTNVSFDWVLNDQLLDDTGDVVSLFLLKPGIYILSVEAYNKVTDFAYKTIARPKAISKIYVQEKLKGIKICLKIDGEEVCERNIIELPLEGKISFIAKVLPSTEKALRFTWNIGTPELKRSNIPLLEHHYQTAGWYTINVTAQNHISSTSSSTLQLHLVQKVANLTSILCQGPNLVNHLITFHVMYWFGSNLTFQWDFGDGTPLITTHSSFVQHSYTDVGEYWITVNVWNAFSHDNITTNMFFLHQLCQKPHITFLSEKNRVANVADDVLVEPEILCNCAKNSVKYKWTVKDETGSIVNFQDPTILHQRQLLIPKHYLSIGKYLINIRVAMTEFIVYAESFTTIEIKYSKSEVRIDGGYVRHLGNSDSVCVMARLHGESHESRLKNELISFSWSCVPIYQKHLSCFKSDVPNAFLSNETERFVLFASSLNPTLSMVVINVTAQGKNVMSASQILEIQPVPHTLLININCEVCHNHQVNKNDLIKLKASCQNCDNNNNLKFKWKIWLIDEGKHHMHFSNYKCVQADGSTFFIVAPNNTLYQTSLNESIAQDTSYIEAQHHNSVENGFSNQSVSEDLPPFPNLPGFPEEAGLLQEMQHLRTVRNVPDYLDPVEDFSDASPYLQYPYEGEAQYDDNTTMFNASYPEFLPYSPHEFDFDDEDYPRPEEGFPGESGSAGARDHGSHRFNEHLTENDIEEGAVPPRVDGQNVFVHEPSIVGDPVRDTNTYHKTPSPHLISRPRTLLTFSNANTTTGFDSNYLILKRGLLKAGSSYLIQVSVSNTENNLEGFAMEYIRVNVGPVNGRCTLMPVKGYSLNFNFQLHCFEWKSAHQPLFYELRYSLYQDDPGHLIYYGLNRNAKFILPAGLASDSYNVYVNVVIKDSINATTNVCSLIRKVEPLSINSSLIQYVYNETFHPGSILTKYLEEKQNQAVLHRVHAYSSSLNHHRFTGVSLKSSEDGTLLQKIKLKFLEIIDNMEIISKVEAVQALSCLSEIIQNTNELSMFEIQRAFNIYKKIYLLKHMLLGDYSLEVLERNIFIFLSKLAFASHSTPYRNEELIYISREFFIKEIQEKLKTRYLTEEPIHFEVPHTLTSSLHITSTKMHKPLHLKLKSTSIEITEDFSEQFESCFHTNCDDKENCTSLIVQEFDYATIPNESKLAPIHFSKIASILVTLPDCDHSEVVDVGKTTHVNAQFFRFNHNEVFEKVILRSNTVYIYKVNITEEDTYYSLLFHVRFHFPNMANIKHSTQVYFRYQSYPTPWKYDWKNNLAPNVVDQSYFIPESYIKVPGIYYFAVWTYQFEESLYTDSIILELDVNIWKQMCVSQDRGYWSHESCQSLNSSNKDWIHCKCSSLEIAGFSVPLKADILQIPTNDLLKSYFNVFPLTIFIALLAIYILLLILNYRKDSTINLSYSPIPLRDNSDEHKQLYLICTKTGMHFSSGTTASVFIVLHGMHGVTETRQLIGFNAKKFCFQKGATDLFLLSTPESLGPLVKIEVMHNNYGLSPSWYLKDVLIKDLETGYSYTFNCYKWLSAEKDDGLIERELMLSDTASTFSSLFFNNVIAYVHDFSMWNSVLCTPPRTFFTGAQRLTCCLCFLLNSAFCFTALQNQILSKFELDHSILHLSSNTLILCLLVSAMATLPQIVLTILFRLSRPPTIGLNPHFNRLFFSWSLRPFYCWLRQKHSNTSRSSGRSISDTDGSDSLYSSFEESSILSMSNIMDESFSSDEKQELSASLSISNVSDPVSPLQKSISTWQAFENWVRKKHNIIMNADTMGRQHLYDDKNEHSVENEEIVLEELNHFVNESMNDLDETLTSTYDSLSSGSESQGLTSSHTYSHSTISEKSDVDLRLQLLFLPTFFYFVAWLLTLLNATVSLTFILINISSYSFIKCAFLMKYIFLCILCSCLVWTPFIILLVAVMLSLYQYSKQNVYRVPTSKISKNDEPKCTESSYKRMEYFRNYLRPPKEEILERFRQCALKEKILCTFHCHIWNFIVIFLLLLALLLPVNKQMRYQQQSSIHKWLFRSSSSFNTRSPSTKSAMTEWLQVDFINTIYSEDYSTNLGFTTGCILVHDITIKYFGVVQIDNIPDYSCNNSKNIKINQTFVPEFEKSVLHGYHQTYSEENIVVLNDNKINAVDLINEFSQFISNISSGAVSVEFLLFNPSFSLLNFINIQFEFAERNVITTNSITTVKLMDMNCFLYLMKFFIHLIFLLTVLMECNNQCWKLFKYSSVYLKKMWNYYTFLFNIVSISYLSYYFSYILMLKRISHQLKESDLKSNSDIMNAAMYESINQNLLAFLIFMHLLKSFRFLMFSHRLKALGKRLLKSWKMLLVTIIVVSFFLGLCDFMRRIFSGLKTQSLHPVFICLDAIGSLFKDNRKPEIIKETVAFEKCISIIICFIFIALYTYLFAFIRAVLIRNKSSKLSGKKHISVKDSGKILNKKLKEFFLPEKPQIILKENYILPVEFLLLELEELGEKLLKKADELFPKEDDEVANSSVDVKDSGEFLKTLFEITNEELKSEINDTVIKVMQNCDFKPLTNSEVDVVKRLNATVPRLSKVSGKKILPTSLNASLASQRKFKGQDINLSASLQCHKIRKTYPLQLNSDSSSETFSCLEKERIPNFTLRKTKSKGKGKSCELDLNLPDDHALK